MWAFVSDVSSILNTPNIVPKVEYNVKWTIGNEIGEEREREREKKKANFFLKWQSTISIFALFARSHALLVGHHPFFIN